MNDSIQIIKSSTNTLNYSSKVFVNNNINNIQKKSENAIVVSKNNLKLKEFSNNPVFLNNSKHFRSETLKNTEVIDNNSLSENKFKTFSEKTISTEKSNTELYYNNVSVFAFLFSIIIFAWIRFNFDKYIRQIYLSAISYQESYRLYKSNNVLIDRIYWFMTLITIIVGGVYFAQISNFFDLQIYNYNKSTYLFISPLIISGFFIQKTFLSAIISYITDLQSLYNENLHSSFIYYKLMGIFILPIIFILSYIESDLKIFVIYFSFFGIITINILMFYRSIKIFLQKGISLFYTFLYLCILEILPVFIFYRLIIRGL